VVSVRQHGVHIVTQRRHLTDEEGTGHEDPAQAQPDDKRSQNRPVIAALPVM
jgi:hypothetical protein